MSTHPETLQLCWCSKSTTRAQLYRDQNMAVTAAPSLSATGGSISSCGSSDLQL